MKGIHIKLLLICLMVLIGFSCSFPGNLINLAGNNSGKISRIMFCADVTDEGDCIDAGEKFPAGTQSVYAFFTYENMKDGQKWSRRWTQNGDLYDEHIDEAWEDGEQGWLAYSIEDNNGLSGQYSLTLSIGKQKVQEASFSVEPAAAGKASAGKENTDGFPAFGPITTAESASDNAFPIGAAKEFAYGIKEVVAVFPYTNMSSDMSYIAEWLLNGQELVRKEYPWEDTRDGMHYTSLTDDKPLSAGVYTLNLYLQDELVRTARFTITGGPQAEPAKPAANNNPAAPAEQKPNRPATPQEVVDAGAMKYFNSIYTANLPILNQIIQDNLNGWTKIKIVNDNPCGANAMGCFRETCDKRWGGTVYLPREKIQNAPDVEITATLVHELTHGMQSYDGMKCGCTVQKEFYAVAAELDYIYYSGHTDYFNAQYGRLWNDNGKVDTGLLWSTIKDAYYGDKCPEY
ncbi:MAG: hypothetical protein GYA15_12185 [Leptolinea sp.]|jgi:hypothetical protein|nr:hypothetical protein [Leptolinea sp.]